MKPIKHKEKSDESLVDRFYRVTDIPRDHDHTANQYNDDRIEWFSDDGLDRPSMYKGEIDRLRENGWVVESIIGDCINFRYTGDTNE